MSTRVRCFVLVRDGGGVSTRDDAGEVRSTLPTWKRADGGDGRWTLASPAYVVEGVAGAPQGAMWFADWMDDCQGDSFLGGRPTDGWLVVRCGEHGHDWLPDLRASNCTMPQDDAHRCWVRHGSPPDVTVDKAGVTCAAGAGSIGFPGFHGFLRGGWLEID